MTAITTSRIKKMSPQFVVADLGRSLEFYTNTLGFAIEFRYEDFYAAITKDGCSIHLKSGKPSIEPRHKGNNEDLDLVFSVEGVENLYEELSSRSVEFTQPIREMPYGREFYIKDPDGYRIGFLEAV